MNKYKMSVLKEELKSGEKRNDLAFGSRLLKANVFNNIKVNSNLQAIWPNKKTRMMFSIILTS